MRPRLFWSLFASFALVISLGVCGMLGFIILALSGIWQPSSMHNSFNDIPSVYGVVLGDYYLAHGRSWDGVQERMNQLPLPFENYVLLDTAGEQVAGTASSASESMRSRRVPVTADGEQIGTLVLRSGSPSAEARRAFATVARSFVLAGAVLAAVLLGLAVLMARWLSHPLRTMTKAAQQVAAGDLQVRVGESRVRELNELAAAFNGMALSLEGADRTRRQMTADIAHELRTPLSIIKGRLEGLQDGVYEPTPQQIELLLGESALLERLIDDLRVLALAEAGQLQLYPTATDPAELLAAVEQSFAAEAGQRGIALRLEAPPVLPPIAVDAQRMQQVLANLLANALRHTPAGGQVVLGATLLAAGGNTVRLWVRDTGSGIAPEDLPHVFDRFYRADRSRTRSSGGSGLGLAIARQIVLNHTGMIAVESTPGQGTNVSIDLPVATGE